MLDLALLLFFSFHLHQLAERKGLPPWNAVIRFVLAYFAVLIIFSIWIIAFYGGTVFTNPDLLKEIAPFLPIVFGVEISLFLFFRYRLAKLPDYENREDDDTDSAPKEEKDLSYFR